MDSTTIEAGISCLKVVVSAVAFVIFSHWAWEKWIVPHEED